MFYQDLEKNMFQMAISPLTDGIITKFYKTKFYKTKNKDKDENKLHCTTPI